MRKKQAPKKICKRKKSYKRETLIAAWKAVENGMSMYEASKLFGVPKQTLGDRKSGKVRDPLRIGTGQQPIFVETHERNLVDHITYLSSLGCVYSKAEVMSLANDYARFLSLLPDDKSLSSGWFYRLLVRWPTLQWLRPRSIEIYRAKCATPQALKHYFSELKNVMEKYNLQDKPHCIYNVDETGIDCEHKPGMVVALKNSKPGTVVSSRSPTATVIACGNANGTFVPPFIIFKGKRTSTDDLSQNCTHGTEVRMSDTGWSDNTLFMDFLQNHFLKYCMGSDTDYKLLMYDGHAIHINISLIEWAKEHKVILFVLPPLASHLTQPQDVGIFGPFKRYLFSECENFIRENTTEAITKCDLGEIICRVYPKALSHENLVSGFQKTGIYPLNAEVMDKNQLAILSGESPDGRPSETDTYFEKVTKNKKDRPVKTGGTAISESPLYKKRKHPPKCASPAADPVPCTSTKKVCSKEINTADNDSDMDVTDDEKCCVCGLFEPAQLKHLLSVELVHWAQCEKCNHWVHLKFCVEQKVVRCHTTFLCPHCEH